jgi:hypothetical protein
VNLPQTAAVCTAFLFAGADEHESDFDHGSRAVYKQKGGREIHLGCLGVALSAFNGSAMCDHWSRMHDGGEVHDDSGPVSTVVISFDTVGSPVTVCDVWGLKAVFQRPAPVTLKGAWSGTTFTGECGGHVQEFYQAAALSTAAAARVSSSRLQTYRRHS